MMLGARITFSAFLLACAAGRAAAATPDAPSCDACLILAATTGGPASPKTIDPAPQTTEIEVGSSYENLGNGFNHWRSVYLEGVHRFAPREVIYGHMRETERFAQRDQELLGGFYYPLADTWTTLVEANASPSHHILAKWSVFGQLEKSFPGGWGLHAGLRHTEYAQSNTNLALLTAERYFGDFRAAYSLYVGRPEGAGSAASHRFQFSYYYGDRSSVGIAYTIGKEVENVAPAGVLTTDVRDWGLLGRHWFSRHWAVSFEALWHEQGALYSRRGARAGLRYQF